MSATGDALVPNQCVGDYSYMSLLQPTTKDLVRELSFKFFCLILRWCCCRTVDGLPLQPASRSSYASDLEKGRVASEATEQAERRGRKSMVTWRWGMGGALRRNDGELAAVF